MIKFREQVPSVYTSASRDFQYMSWLIDIVLNYVKHNVDSLYDLPSTTDARLSELLAMTLGFKVKRNYDQKQLAALVAVLPRILKHKGTETAVSIAGQALIAASGAIGTFEIEKEYLASGELRVMLPKDLIDISLFTDLLPYILPAGMTCRIVRTDRRRRNYTTLVGYQGTMLAELIPDVSWDGDMQKSTGMAHLFNAGSEITDFANFRADINDSQAILRDRFTEGLLSNTIIPSLTEVLKDNKGNNGDDL